MASSERTFIANGRVQAHLLARAGDSYEIRLSYRAETDRPEKVSFGWEETDAPEFLRYVGAVTNRTLKGSSDSLSAPRHLAMHSDGRLIFAGSNRRVLGLTRDPETGWLSFAHRFDRRTAPSSSIDLSYLGLSSLFLEQEPDKAIHTCFPMRTPSS